MHFGRRAKEELAPLDRLSFLQRFQHKYLQLFKSLIYWVMPTKRTPTTRYHHHYQSVAHTEVWWGSTANHFIWQLELPVESNHIMGGWSRSADEKWEQKTAVFTSDIVPTAMWKGFEQCKFLLGFCLDVVTTWHCHSNRPDRSVLLGAVENVRSTEEESPVRMEFTVPFVLYYYCVAVFHGPWKETAQRWASTTASDKAMGMSCIDSINHTAKSSLLQNPVLGLPVRMRQSQRSLRWWLRWARAYLGGWKFGWCPAKYHSPQRSFFLWQGSSLCFQCRLLHRALPCQTQHRQDHRKRYFPWPSQVSKEELHLGSSVLNSYPSNWGCGRSRLDLQASTSHEPKQGQRSSRSQMVSGSVISEYPGNAALKRNRKATYYFMNSFLRGS